MIEFLVYMLFMSIGMGLGAVAGRRVWRFIVWDT